MKTEPAKAGQLTIRQNQAFRLRDDGLEQEDKRAQNSRRVRAGLIQVTGTVRPGRGCRDCANGRGPFVLCVSEEGRESDRGCANCLYRQWQNRGAWQCGPKPSGQPQPSGNIPQPAAPPPPPAPSPFALRPVQAPPAPRPVPAGHQYQDVFSMYPHSTSANYGFTGGRQQIGLSPAYQFGFQYPQGGPMNHQMNNGFQGGAAPYRQQPNHPDHPARRIRYIFPISTFPDARLLDQFRGMITRNQHILAREYARYLAVLFASGPGSLVAGAASLPAHQPNDAVHLSVATNAYLLDEFAARTPLDRRDAFEELERHSRLMGIAIQERRDEEEQAAAADGEEEDNDDNDEDL